MNLQILQGDCIEQLRTLADESVQCCVTSPPYWGLRDYGVAGQIGLEKTPQEYLEKMTAVFREVKRVLRKDGTCWVNLGDSYAQDGKWGGQSGNKNYTSAGGGYSRERKLTSLKPKDLIGIPWRVAFALQADGWYLRSDIIWHKPNPMPESVTDRPTKSHEYIFLLSKSEKYFYDAEAIKEPVTGNAHTRGDGVNPKSKWKTPDGWDTTKGEGGHGTFHKTGREKGKVKQNESFSEAVTQLVSNRNKRTVWTVPTYSFSDAHFATYPPNLIKPCILAGTSAFGACIDCGAPYQPIVEKGAADLEHQKACGGDQNGEYHGQATKDFTAAKAQNASEVKARILAGMCEKKIIGWQSTCKCRGLHSIAANVPAPEYIKPCVVLDPFGGSGTTGQVALELGRRAILIELNPAYIPLINQRTHITPGLAL